MLTFLDFFARRLRLANPWRFKVPALMAIPYFMLLTNAGSNVTAYVSILLSYCTIIGLAGLAYLFNDLGDREIDQKAGKENTLAGMAKSRIALLCGFFALLALGPWFWFPMDQWSFVLLGCEISLFYLYAFPPFRLKERGLAGVVADALYAHLLPALLAANTFYLIGEKQFSAFLPYLLALSGWQFFLGVRNILLHQLSDQSADEGSGVNTVVTRYGSKRVLGWLKWIILPLEGLSFLGFAWFVNGYIAWFLPVYGIYLLITAFMGTKNEGEKVRQVAYAYLDGFYIKWYPLLVLSALVMAPIEVTPILLAHLLLFRNEIVPLIQKAWKYFHSNLYKLSSWLWQPESYLVALGRNLVLFLGYAVFFIGLYFTMEHWIEADHFLFHQRWLSKVLLGVILIHVVLLLWKRRTLSVATFSTFLLERGSPYNLALVRFYFMSAIAREAYRMGLGPMSSWSMLPESARVPLPFIGWFIELVPISPEIYTAAVWGAIITCHLAAIGFFTRVSLIASIPFLFYMWSVPCFFGKLNHNQLVLWIPLILAFAPSGDALSIDALIRWIRRKKRDTDSAIRYGLPLKIIWLQLAIIYCFSGLHKLWDTGLAWGISDSVINQMHNEWFEHYDLIPGFRLDLLPWLAKLVGAGVMFGEIFYPVLLFHPMLRPLGFLWGQAFHRITAYFVYIDFHHLRILSWSFINWHGIAKEARTVFQKRIGLNWKEVKARLTLKQSFIPLSIHGMNGGKPLLVVGAVLLVMNGAFSIFSIHTWPFSSYPTYSAYFDNYFETVEMDLRTSEGKRVRYLELGEQQNFRWENIRPFELEIINAYHDGDTEAVQTLMAKYVNLWQTSVSGLENLSSMDAFLVKSPLNPEHRNDTLERVHLVKLDLSKRGTP